MECIEESDMADYNELGNCLSQEVSTDSRAQTITRE